MACALVLTVLVETKLLSAISRKERWLGRYWRVLSSAGVSKARPSPSEAVEAEESDSESQPWSVGASLIRRAITAASSSRALAPAASSRFRDALARKIRVSARYQSGKPARSASSSIARLRSATASSIRPSRERVSADAAKAKDMMG